MLLKRERPPRAGVVTKDMDVVLARTELCGLAKRQVAGRGRRRVRVSGFQPA